MSGVIQQRMPGHRHDLGGGFSVSRVLPGSPRRAIGPFVFIDYFGPTTLPPDRPMDVRPHPHIGLSTLTYLWQGRIRHRDGLGSDVRIEPGAVNWMTAGRGIVHSERTAPEDRGSPLPIHGLQLWLALPLDQEEAEPAFSHTAADVLPVFAVNNVKVTLVTGSAWDRQSPVPTLGEPLLADLRLPAGSRLALPDTVEQRALFVVDGEATANGESLKPGELAIFTPGETIHIDAGSDCHAVLFGGPPLDAPRYLWWNFVSSSEARIQQACDDWQAQRYAMVEGDDEFIPLPAEDLAARPPVLLKPE